MTRYLGLYYLYFGDVFNILIDFFCCIKCPSVLKETDKLKCMIIISIFVVPFDFLGSLCDSWSGQCYLLPVLDTVLVRKSWRRRGFGSQMLENFCSTFHSEKFLGVSSPLSPSWVTGQVMLSSMFSLTAYSVFFPF